MLALALPSCIASLTFVSGMLALVFIGQARAYLDGAHKTVDLAALGRRIAEPEAELLVLLEEAG